MRRIMVTGNITADAEVKQLTKVKVINFCVAVNESYKDETGNRVEKTFFYNCSIFRENNIKIAEFLLKGVKVLLEGEPEVEIYQNKEGQTVGGIKINVKNVELLGGGKRPEPTSNNNGKKEDKNDVPF